MFGMLLVFNQFLRSSTSESKEITVIRARVLVPR
jgi:hypothetical protein